MRLAACFYGILSYLIIASKAPSACASSTDEWGCANRVIDVSCALVEQNGDSITSVQVFAQLNANCMDQQPMPLVLGADNVFRLSFEVPNTRKSVSISIQHRDSDPDAKQTLRGLPKVVQVAIPDHGSPSSITIQRSRTVSVTGRFENAGRMWVAQANSHFASAVKREVQESITVPFVAVNADGIAKLYFTRNGDHLIESVTVGPVAVGVSEVDLGVVPVAVTDALYDVAVLFTDMPDGYVPESSCGVLRVALLSNATGRIYFASISDEDILRFVARVPAGSYWVAVASTRDGLFELDLVAAASNVAAMTAADVPTIDVQPVGDGQGQEQAGAAVGQNTRVVPWQSVLGGWSAVYGDHYAEQCGF